MGKRIVIALGGNALGKNLEEQMHAVKTTASAIADLIEDGHEVVIAHGNGPQVGMIQNAFAAYHKQQAKSDIMPLSMCVAMSQGYIGYDLQNMIGEELDRRGLGIHCATVLTQVAVDPADPAFQHPTKPIGAFMTEEEAKKLAAEKGIDVAEDAGRGWRQVVASPRPKEIVEIAKWLSAAGVASGAFFAVFKFLEREKHQQAEIAAIKREQSVMCYGILACLKGLKEQGCNGPVTEALHTLEKHLNQSAHGQEET